MKTNETNNTARKLTLEEIAAMPRKTDLYFTYEEDCPDDGIVWNWGATATIVAPGMNGRIIVVSEGGYRDFDIYDDLLNDPDISFWDHEPDQQQLKGISEEEYGTVPENVLLKNLSHRITSEKMTYERFCRAADLDLDTFTKAMTGACDFTAGMIAKISKTLNLTDDELMKMFTVSSKDAEPAAEAPKQDYEPKNPMTDEIARLAVKLFRMPVEKSQRLVPMIWDLIKNDQTA